VGGLGIDMMRILIVEDEPLLAMMLEESLGELGHEVAGSAATVEQGLAALDSTAIDMALLDFTLGENSDAVPIALRLQERGIPFAYLTGHRSLPQGRAIPPAPLLTKPFTLGELDATLRETKLAA
jgi:DNA-binding response OmpR family regulator